jgi:predicted CXXCH cytochrome family protein
VKRAAILAAVSLALGCGRAREAEYRRPSGPAAKFVDEASCAKCHEKEYRAWLGSHHQLAMQTATEKTVLADFNDSTFTYYGITSRFFRRDGKFFVHTDGPDGKLADSEISYTFGVSPLQEYLIAMPGGRLQVLQIAWDTERKRWFHLYPDEKIDFKDSLHWTKPSQNWNFMCAECHSTDLKKNWNAASNRYETKYFQINVACQACHGPGSRHVEIAEKERGSSPTAVGWKGPSGLEVSLKEKDSKVQIETCARCHSRRAALWGTYRHGARLMDTHLPALLTESLYQADGQIMAEDYEYGSFLQSKMFAKGVRCSDCHDPHGGKIRRRGDDLCLTCHNDTTHPPRPGIDFSGLKSKRYDSPLHHFHAVGKPGSHCVDCHTAIRDYMVVHARHDHGFRIPRPDLTVALGTPNTCNDCHKDKTPQWAADAAARWYGPGRRQEPLFAAAIVAGRGHKPGAAPDLAGVVNDPTQPGIVRATALDLLKEYPGGIALAAFELGLGDPDPMVRRAALEGVEVLAPKERIPLAGPLLSDPVRAVRIEAVPQLAPVEGELGERKAAFDAALAEFFDVQKENADQPSSFINLGNLWQSRGDAAQAEHAYRRALALDSTFAPAYANLADLMRSAGREKEAEATLRAGLRVAEGTAALHHALGLTLVRRKETGEALRELALAVKQAPDDARYAYVYGVALHDSEKPREGIEALETALMRHPGDRDLLLSLAGYAREAGDSEKAASYLGRLRAIDPSDPALGTPPGR